MGEVIDFLEYKRKKEEAAVQPVDGPILDEFLEHLADRCDAFNADPTAPVEIEVTMSIYDWCNMANEISGLLDELDDLKSKKQPAFRKAKGRDVFVSNFNEGGAA